ncbi:MAG: hypothetical protein J2P46_02080 [Zavarzinella sp.]|nr:hypothetical protein [Zavarzinella sp.]
MKITVELPEPDVREICEITGERKKGPAVRKFLVGALQMKRRERIVQKFLSGEWGVELKGYEEARAAERKASERDAQSWKR